MRKTFSQLVDAIEQDAFVRNSLVLTFTGLDEMQHLSGREVLRSKLNSRGEGKEPWATVEDKLSHWPPTVGKFTVIVTIRYEIDGVPCPRILIDRILDSFGARLHPLAALRPREVWWHSVIRLTLLERFLHFQGVFTVDELRRYAAKSDEEIIADVHESRRNPAAKTMRHPSVVPGEIHEALAAYDAAQTEGGGK